MSDEAGSKKEVVPNDPGRESHATQPGAHAVTGAAHPIERGAGEAGSKTLERVAYESLPTVGKENYWPNEFAEWAQTYGPSLMNQLAASLERERLLREALAHIGAWAEGLPHNHAPSDAGHECRRCWIEKEIREASE